MPRDESGDDLGTLPDLFRIGWCCFTVWSRLRSGMRRSTAGYCWFPVGRAARHFSGRCCRFIVIQIFEKITFGTSYVARLLQNRLMGFAPHAFGFHGQDHPTVDSLSQLTLGNI